MASRRRRRWPTRTPDGNAILIQGYGAAGLRGFIGAQMNRDRWKAIEWRRECIGFTQCPEGPRYDLVCRVCTPLPESSRRVDGKIALGDRRAPDDLKRRVHTDDTPSFGTFYSEYPSTLDIPAHDHFFETEMTNSVATPERYTSR